ncbi:hypothetical protein [Nocardia crassostreae]|uniref:hypothetical protein n=1 Tax=Nocardia crassostreae TaxID=53428 RepID=UPI0008360490|nr:hypothetical protein [Nocardia crassostreae]
MTENGGGQQGGAKGIPIDLGETLFDTGDRVEFVVQIVSGNIAKGCRAAGLADNCVRIETQTLASAPTPTCKPSPDEPNPDPYTAYVGMSKQLPSTSEGERAVLNSGETLYIYTKTCAPEEVETTDPETSTTTPPSTTTTTPPVTTTTGSGG